MARIKAFYIASESKHNALANQPGYVDEIMFGAYTRDDKEISDCGHAPKNVKTTELEFGEMAFRWRDLGSRYGLSCRLESFDDSWQLLADFAPMLAELGTLTIPVSTEAVSTILKKHGFTDLTARA